MKTAPVKNNQTIGSHLHEGEQLPIGVPVVDVGVLPIGKQRVEDHAVLKVFIPFGTGEKFIAEFQAVREVPNLLVRHDGHALQPRGEMPIQPRAAHAGVRGIEVDHGGDVGIDVRLTLSDVEAVLLVGDALKHRGLRLKKRVQPFPPEFTDRLHEGVGLDVH